MLYNTILVNKVILIAYIIDMFGRTIATDTESYYSYQQKASVNNVTLVGLWPGSSVAKCVVGPVQSAY